MGASIGIDLSRQSTGSFQACSKRCASEAWSSQPQRLRCGFSDDNYWSSTENNSNNAWKQNFNNGNQNNNNKSNTNRVRCVRRWTIRRQSPSARRLPLLLKNGK